MLGNTHIIIAKSGITRFQYQVTTQSSPPFNLQLSHAFCHRINFIRSSDTSGLREMNGGWIPAEVRRRFGSFRVQRIADYMRCHCREEEAFSDAPVPEKLLSRPGSLNLFGHSRREIGVKDAFSQRSHIFQTFPLGQTCRSPIDGEHIPSSMHRELFLSPFLFPPSRRDCLLLLNSTVDRIQVVLVHASKQSLIIAKVAGRSLRPQDYWVLLI